jgi:hypothetical protein
MAPKKTHTSRDDYSFVHVGLLAGLVTFIAIILGALLVLGAS